MKVTFIAEITSDYAEYVNAEKPIKCTKILESENPEELLKAIEYINGTLIGTPTVEKLLTHLFVKRAAYANRNYIIYTKTQ